MHRGRGRGRGRHEHAIKPKAVDISDHTSRPWQPKLSVIVTTTSEQERFDIKQFMLVLQEFCSTNEQQESYDIPGLNPMFIVDLKHYLMETLVPIGIRYKLEEVTERSEYARLLLCTDRNNANFRIPLVRQANGIIILIKADKTLKTPKAELLVVSSNEFSSGHSAVDIEQFLREEVYDIYEIQDGTTFNMYYWQDRWIMSTRNSFDIAGMVWRDARYDTVIAECFAKYPEFKLTNLDKSLAYTFGYRHPAHHPFQALNDKEPRMWLITAYDLTKLSTVQSAIGIPYQKTLAKPISATDKLYSSMAAKCASALSNYITAESNPEVFLGYILRTKDPRAAAVSDILMESTLFSEIKKCMYDMPYIQNRDKRAKAKSNFVNLNNVIVSNWLDFSKRSIFFQLFPQYKQHSVRFDELLKRALVGISDARKNTNIFSDNKDDMIVSILSSKLSVLLGPFVDTHLLQDLSRMYNMAMNPEYVDMYMECFFG
jgi:hypothetical protein